MHTLFALEDLRGLRISKDDGEICLRLGKGRDTYDDMIKMLTAQKQQAARLEAGDIAKANYDDWRYNYPKAEAERTKAAIDELRVEKESVMIWDI